jgi:hypothetical protein
MAGRRARRACARYQRVLLLSNSSSLVEVKSVCQLIELRAKKWRPFFFYNDSSTLEARKLKIGSIHSLLFPWAILHFAQHEV